MHLRIAQHLQAVLDRAQIAVGRIEFLYHLRMQEPLAAELRQHLEQPRSLQSSVLPTPDDELSHRLLGHLAASGVPVLGCRSA